MWHAEPMSIDQVTTDIVVSELQDIEQADSDILVRVWRGVYHLHDLVGVSLINLIIMMIL
jgi:hypothetical protein